MSDLSKMITFINMVITGVENGSPSMILVAFQRNLMRKKMRYPPGFVDLIYLKFFNTGNGRIDRNPKNGYKWGPRGFHGSKFSMYLTTILSKVALHPKDANLN